MKHILFTLLFLGLNLALHAQFNIKGNVTSDHVKLDGVNISIVNSNKGTITNSRGQFQIQNITPTDTVRFSMLGYKSKDTLFSSALEAVNINMNPSNIALSEIEIMPPNYALNTIQKVSDNLANNYPSSNTAFNALFRKQIVEDGNYLFLGNAEISILCPAYLSNENKRVFLNSIKLTKNDLEHFNIDIPPVSLLDFSPKFGFITSSEYFDFTYLKSVKWNDALYIKIAFKTKEKYWEDSPFEGVLTIEKASYAIAEIEWKTLRKEDTNKGYNKKMGIYKGTIITNTFTNHISYQKKDDNKWYFNYNRIIWDVTLKYKKYPDENKNIILKSDVYSQKTIPISGLEDLKTININKDLFNKEKSLHHANWKDLNPILPDFE
ncbi:carboxypeptidase-like regulatory domain-containing protein [Formosa sp. L2A11]|uniref:carboxypeptidase-like regulatory domain-containing protein n=1 Tax=Formosa sp. L2A11 TaxID=2686363 RepID=UPI00131A923D|nr:carboxypeptidase-like regulatory domain-containing protein [Formosa sp. L2A11]